MIMNVMNSKSVFVVVILMISFLGGSARAGQDAKRFTKSEILSLIKEAESGPHEVSQGDIAVEVQRRGVDFAVDDRTLDEFRRAGARSFLLNSIKHPTEDSI